jgi:outer membrane immunogenic protein
MEAAGAKLGACRVNDVGVGIAFITASGTTVSALEYLSSGAVDVSATIDGGYQDVPSWGSVVDAAGQEIECAEVRRVEHRPGIVGGWTGGLVPGVATGLALGGIYDLDPGQDGFIGGGQVGYNSQFNNLVTGIEADIQGLANNGRANRPFTGPVPGFSEQYFGTQSAQAEIRWLGTLRGRLGGLISPSALIYVTGGLAYGSVNAGGAINAQENASFVAKPFDFLPSVGGAINSQTRAGWTLGGGWEWMFAPRWSVKAEYLYYDLGTVSTNYGVSTLCTPVACAIPSMPIYGTAAVYTSTRLNGNIARAGVNYRF